MLLCASNVLQCAFCVHLRCRSGQFQSQTRTQLHLNTDGEGKHETVGSKKKREGWMEGGRKEGRMDQAQKGTRIEKIKKVPPEYIESPRWEELDPLCSC